MRVSVKKRVIRIGGLREVYKGQNILLGILGSLAGLVDLGGADGGWAGFVGAICKL